MVGEGRLFGQSEPKCIMLLIGGEERKGREGKGWVGKGREGKGKKRERKGREERRLAFVKMVCAKKM